MCCPKSAPTKEQCSGRQKTGQVVIVDTQSVVLDAAVAAGVLRFIASDFAWDFTKLVPGQNRNFDLRREFMAYLDKAPIKKQDWVVFADHQGSGPCADDTVPVGPSGGNKASRMASAAPCSGESNPAKLLRSVAV